MIIACCCHADHATKLADALAKKAIGPKTHGDGERLSKKEYQEQFMCVVKEEIVVVGRGSIIKDVSIKHVLRTPMNGLPLVAVDFAVGIQDWLSTRVVAIVVESEAIAGSDFGLENWDVIAQALYQKSVRVLAFKDSSAVFRASLQDLMQFT